MNRKVLVTDDEIPLLELMDKGLSRAGFEITTAESAEEALEIVKKDTFQAFLIDLKLPQMDGIELFKRLKADRPVAFYFAITGYTSIFDLVRCREVGFDNYFSKPFKIDDLVRSLDYALESMDRWRIGQDRLRQAFKKST